MSWTFAEALPAGRRCGTGFSVPGLPATLASTLPSLPTPLALPLLRPR